MVNTLITLEIKLILKFCFEKSFAKNKIEFTLNSGLTNAATIIIFSISADLFQLSPYKKLIISKDHI